MFGNILFPVLSQSRHLRSAFSRLVSGRELLGNSLTFPERKLKLLTYFTQSYIYHLLILEKRTIFLNFSAHCLHLDHNHIDSGLIIQFNLTIEQILNIFESDSSIQLFAYIWYHHTYQSGSVLVFRLMMYFGFAIQISTLQKKKVS